MLFFTDYGNVAKVERCNMDGTNRTRLVDYKIEQPTAVALDVVKKLVYWADAYLDYIDVVDYQGKNRHTVIHGSQVSATLHRFLPSTGRTLWTNVGFSYQDLDPLTGCSLVNVPIQGTVLYHCKAGGVFTACCFNSLFILDKRSFCVANKWFIKLKKLSHTWGCLPNERVGSLTPAAHF